MLLCKEDDVLYLPYTTSFATQADLFWHSKVGIILFFYSRVKAVFNHPRERGEFLYASKFNEI